MAQKRILKDLKELQNSTHDNITANPANSDNIFHWRGVIKGPVGSPYEGGSFRFNVEFPTDYPFKPPVFNFMTQIYHPNINVEGKVCLDILSRDWNPAVSVSQGNIYIITNINLTVLEIVYLLLKEPNPESAVQPSIGAEYRDNYEAFAKTAREYTQQYAQQQDQS
jgi:ubiquitin-conjugating enzyme E2 D/E